MSRDMGSEKKNKRERWVLDSTQPLTTGVNINMGFIWGNEAGIFDPQVAVYLKLCIIFLAVHLKYTSHMASPYCSFLIAVLSEFYSNGVQQHFFKGFKNFAFLLQRLMSWTHEVRKDPLIPGFMTSPQMDSDCSAGVIYLPQGQETGTHDRQFYQSHLRFGKCFPKEKCGMH